MPPSATCQQFRHHSCPSVVSYQPTDFAFIQQQSSPGSVERMTAGSLSFCEAQQTAYTGYTTTQSMHLVSTYKPRFAAYNPDRCSTTFPVQTMFQGQPLACSSQYAGSASHAACFVRLEPYSAPVMLKAESPSAGVNLSGGPPGAPSDDKRKHACNVIGCGKRFTRPDELKRHLRIHFNIRPFICPHCNRSFGRSDHLKTHIRSHTGERPYLCEPCGRRFARSDERTRHRKVRGCRPINEPAHSSASTAACLSSSGSSAGSSLFAASAADNETQPRRYSAPVLPSSTTTAGFALSGLSRPVSSPEFPQRFSRLPFQTLPETHHLTTLDESGHGSSANHDSTELSTRSPSAHVKKEAFEG